MNKREFNEMISDISSACRVSSADAKRVIIAYLEAIEHRTLSYHASSVHASSGIITLDCITGIRPGITCIYGHDSIGKTAVAKRIAAHSRNTYKFVLYYDAENTLYCHDQKELEGILLANATAIQGIDDWLQSRLLDVAIIDTITALQNQSAMLLYHKMKKAVPYIILVGQMREWVNKPAPVPAIPQQLLGCAQMHLHLTSREKITIGGVDMLRVQWCIGKYEGDHTIENTRGSFIIRNGMVDNLYTAIDVLRSRGRMVSRGPLKMLGHTTLGSYRDIEADMVLTETVLTAAWNELSKEPCHVEHYFDRPVQHVPTFGPGARAGIATV